MPEVIEEQDKLPVFVVTGSNWTMEVPLDEFNAQFDIGKQQHEAATRAIEALNVGREDCFVVMNPDSKNENPQVGTVVLVHLKDTDPDKAVAIETHLCLGDAGLYKEAAAMEAKHKAKIAKLREKTQKAITEQSQHDAELAALAKEVKTPKKKKK